MKLFPMFISLERRLCIVIGGGPVAARKAAVLAEAGALVRVISPDFAEGFPGGTEQIRRVYQPGDLEGAVLAVAATSLSGVNQAVADEADAAGIPVNVADDPDRCTFVFPSVVRRGELTLGVSSGGASPSVSRALRQRLEQMLPEDTGSFLEKISRWRQQQLKAGKSARVPENVLEMLWQENGSQLLESWLKEQEEML